MKSGTIRYVGYMWVVHWEDVGIMLILSPETSHILSVLPLHNSTEKPKSGTLVRALAATTLATTSEVSLLESRPRILF